MVKHKSEEIESDKDKCEIHDQSGDALKQAQDEIQRQ